MKTLLTIVLFFAIGLTLHAATGTPPPPPGIPGENDTLPIPGILVAILAALGYGVYKKFNNQKK